MSELTEQDAEIKRLRAMRLKEYLKLDEKLDALEQKSVSQKVLITELADALEEEFGPVGHRVALKDKRPWNLIQRARESIK